MKNKEKHEVRYAEFGNRTHKVLLSRKTIAMLEKHAGNEGVRALLSEAFERYGGSEEGVRKYLHAL